MKKAIVDDGKTKRAVNPDVIADALDAEDTGFRINPHEGPISLFTLRQFIADRLHSTGGRPKLMGTQKIRRKISFIEDDWNIIEKLTAYYREKEGLNVTSSQVAVALIHAGISGIDKKKIII